MRGAAFRLPPSSFLDKRNATQAVPIQPFPASSRPRLPLSSLIALLALLLGTALFFFDLLLGQKIPVFRDLLVFAVPFKEFLASRLRQGMIPLWNPWIVLGTPFLAGLQTGVFYPPSILLLLDLPLGFDVFIVFHYFVALLGAWFLIRSRRCSVAAAAIGALTFTLGGYLLSMMNVTNHLQAGVWAPWVLLTWERHLEKASVGRWLAFTALVAMQILAGAPETLLMTLGLAAAETGYRSIGKWRELPIATLSLAVALLTAACLTAVQILPTAEYVRESARNQALPYVEVMSWSMEPVSLLQLLFPHGSALGPGDRPGDLCPMFESTQPWIVSLYFGLVPLCLAVVGAAFARERWLWAPAAGAAIVLALGRHLPVLPFLLQVAPQIVGRFRFPEKFFFVTHIGVAMLAAFGVDEVLAERPRAERLAWITAATLAAVSTVFVLARQAFPAAYLQGIVFLSGGFRGADALASLGESVAFRAWRALLILGAFAALLLFRRRGFLSRSTISVLLAGLVATDLATAHYDLNLALPWARLKDRPVFVDLTALRKDRLRVFHYQTDSAAFPGQEPKPVRGLVNLSRLGWRSDSARSLFEQAWQALMFNTPMLEGIGTLSGGDGITRASENMLSDALSLPTRPQSVKLLGIFSVLYLIGATPLDVPSLHRVPTPHDFPFYVYQLDQVLPQAYLATRVHSVSSDLDAFNRMISPIFQPGADAVVSSSPKDWRNICDGSVSSAGRVIVAEQTDDRQRFEVESLCTALLVVNDSYFPGWAATLDGQSTEILRANSLVRGIVVPAGKHEVAFAYRPASFRIGAATSGITLVVLLLVLVGTGTRNRATRMTEAQPPE